MSQLNEFAALQASLRGAIATADALVQLAPRVDSLDPHAEISPTDLEELARVTAAHAIASNALRGLVNTMLARRGVDPSSLLRSSDATTSAEDS
jgi:hypothetical protein